MRVIAFRLLLFLTAALTGCTGLKGISADDSLYVGHEISFVGSRERESGLSQLANEPVRPQPNPRFLWMRPALSRNNMLREKTKKKKFWRNKVANPVLLSHTNPVQCAAAIQNRIFHAGYFNNVVTVDTVLKGQRKVAFRYTILLHTPYRFASVVFPVPSTDILQQIHDGKEASLLRRGDVYSLDAVKQERVRIDRLLKEKGYIYFNPEFITVRVDTVTGDHQVNAEIIVKSETPPESKVPYIIRKVFIHDDHVLEETAPDTLQVENCFLISQHHALKFNALSRGLFLRPGEVYAYSNYMHTIRYMNDLPVIRNSSIKFLSNSKSDSLDVMLYLSQRKRYAYTAEFNAVVRSTNYFGPGVLFSYTDRNQHKGAELLKVDLRGRFEVQIVDGEVNPAYELGLEVNYRLPQFYPKVFFRTTKKSLPKTDVAIGYNLFNRLDLYRLNSVFTNFGYRWSKAEQFTHAFNPVEIIFTRIPESSKSAEFIQYLQENPGVQRSFDEQFIVGAGYEFTFQPRGAAKGDFFFKAGIDLSGNLLNGIYSATDASKDSLGRYTFLGVPFSHFVRTRVDIRYSFNLNKKSKLVTRFSAGVGVPLGNSDVLPYVKQFYVGGTNSLRSFVARSVGPGSEVPPDGYNDLTGDIRLEGNVEYRFTLSGKLKAALFVDAGNIWLFNEDSSRPDGTFRFNTFLDEIAISSGWGLRWDFDFIVARLDFAYTVRTPYLPKDERWTKNINLANPAINIAIGYPF